MKRSKREVAELRWANAILKSASLFFAKETDRPDKMIRYVEQYKDQFGVEAVCGGLKELRTRWRPRVNSPTCRPA